MTVISFASCYDLTSFTWSALLKFLQLQIVTMGKDQAFKIWLLGDILYTIHSTRPAAHIALSEASQALFWKFLVLELFLRTLPVPKISAMWMKPRSAASWTSN